MFIVYEGIVVPPSELELAGGVCVCVCVCAWSSSSLEPPQAVSDSAKKVQARTLKLDWLSVLLRIDNKIFLFEVRKLYYLRCLVPT